MCVSRVRRAWPPALNFCVQIGINYIGSAQELKGCINDANNIRRFLIRAHLGLSCRLFALTCFVTEEYGYQDDDIVMLTDDQRNQRSIPTRTNMVSRRVHSQCLYAPNLQLLHLTFRFMPSSGLCGTHSPMIPCSCTVRSNTWRCR